MGTLPALRTRTAAVAVGTITAASAVSIGALIVVTSDDDTDAPAATSSSTATPYAEQMDTYISGQPLRMDEIRQIGYDMCPVALSAGDCSSYTVEVTDLGGPVGRTQVNIAEGTAHPEGSEVTVTGIQLDASLAHESPDRVAYVAAHEWNHVEQVLRAPTAEERSALSARADATFGARSGAVGPGDGMEVLADCMSSLDDGVGAGTSGAPYYIATRMQDPDVANACEGWADVLEGPAQDRPWWQVF